MKFQLRCSCLRCKKETTTGQLTRSHSGDMCPGTIIKKKRVAWNKGLNKSDPRVRKYSESTSKTMTGRPSKQVWTPEMRKAKSEWRKTLHQEFPETHPNRRLAGNRSKWTYPEKVAGNWLDSNGILYERNKKIGSYYPDFVIGTLIIEIDGEYWHSKEKDSIRDRQLIDLGYTVFRIQSKERIEDRLVSIFSERGSLVDR